MIERFDEQDMFDGLADVERLEEGIYLERVGTAKNAEEYGEEDRMICKDAEPDGIWLAGSMREIRESGAMDPEGNISWHRLRMFFHDRGLVMEERAEASLEDLMEALDADEKVLCTLSDCVLERPEADQLPGISANLIAGVEKPDLCDPGRETVTVSRMREDLDGTDLETYPLTRFLRAWDAGERRILILQKGDES